MSSSTMLRQPAAGPFAALALLLLARPYEGVRHDGVLYFGQALRRSLVPGLSNDSFFAGGSQDTFSVYSWLLAPLYRSCGPAITHQSLLLLGLLGSAGAVWLLLRQWRLSPTWGLLALAVMSPLYGGLRTFGVAENFLTARSLAEPLVMVSLLPLARGRLMHGALCQFAAALIHPLMALPGLVITWLLAAQRDQRWLWLLTLPLAGIALGLAGVAPLTRLITVYDPLWWAAVAGSNVQVALLNWTWSDALTLLTDITVLVVVACSGLIPAPGRRLLLVVALATTCLLAMHAVGTDLLHVVLVTQVQPWRVLWLTHLLATLLAPYLLWQIWRRDGLWRLSAMLLALTLMNNHTDGTYGTLLLVSWALCSVGAWHGVKVSSRVTLFAISACGILLLALATLRLSLELERLHWRPPAWPALDIASHVITTPLLAFALTGLAAAWWPRRTGWEHAGRALSLIFLAIAASHWDRRDDLDRMIESAPTPTPFAAQIPAEADVFWPEQLAGTWGLLQRVSHYNRQQGAGMLFNRETAKLVVPRRDAYKTVRTEFEQCEVGALFGNSPSQLAACPTPTLTSLRSLCRGAVRPDYFVFEHPLSTAPLATWNRGRITLNLYTCSQLGTATDAGR